MALKLMYITNRPEIAQIAEAAGVDRIFVDMEYIGKAKRQGGMDTVQSRHTVEDVEAVAAVLTKAQLLVRVNPVGECVLAGYDYAAEIDRVIGAGAQIVMLPYFKEATEVEAFISCVNGRAKTLLLVETPEAVAQIDRILQIPGIDFVHIGLNDLSLGYGKKFMFELLADGTVERLCRKFRERGIPYGFGGIASLGKGAVPAEMVIGEHYRLGSSCAILSRSFCDVEKVKDLNMIEAIFTNGLREIRAFEAECERGRHNLSANQATFCKAVEAFVASKESL